MPSRQSFVIFGVLGLAAFFGLSLSHALQWGVEQYGIVDPLPFGTRELPLTAVIAYVIALCGGVFLLRYAATRTLAGEIVDELARVSWPSQQETGNATVVVIVAVVVCSVYLGIFDTAWLWLTDMILGVQASTPG